MNNFWSKKGTAKHRSLRRFSRIDQKAGKTSFTLENTKCGNKPLGKKRNVSERIEGVKNLTLRRHLLYFPNKMSLCYNHRDCIKRRNIISKNIQKPNVDSLIVSDKMTDPLQGCSSSLTQYIVCHSVISYQVTR